MLLDEAINLILDNTDVLGCRSVQLQHAFSRVCGSNPARLPVPCYDQSTRDGYVICGSGEPAGAGEYGYRLRGEIPAGLCHAIGLEPGECYRIMTGGLVPRGSDRVITQEACRLSGNYVLVPAAALEAPPRFISAAGSTYQAGEQLVAPGTRLDEAHLALFAAAGNWTVSAYRRPRVAFLCSGSELVMADGEPESGQKFSSNHLLLGNLIRRYGSRPVGYGIVPDDAQAIGRLLDEIIGSDADIIISTGGIGPGKYDLFDDVLTAAGAHILYRSLQVRPGKSTLFGLIGNKRYFGLPGPPSAVRILFHELIGPSLKKMQGLTSCYSQRSEAFLDHDISLKSATVLCFRDGCYALAEGRVVVGYPQRNQTGNCLIMLEPGRTRYKRGDRLTISLAPSF